MNVIRQIVSGEGDNQSIKMIVKANERGPQGEQGAKGDAATIAAGEVYAVEEGQQAVINTGTSSNAVFDFYLPKGPKGDDGAIKYTAGTGIKITDGNVIEATGDATAAWGGIQGDITDQTDLQNEFGEYTKTEDLATVATSGKYTDLTDTPSIPTVNDATLTIQNNGTNVATFTANSDTNTTANIVSPVNIGEVLSTPTDVAYVSTNNIQTGAVTTDKIAQYAVTADKFAQYAVNNKIITEDDLSPSEDTPTGWASMFTQPGLYATGYDSFIFTNQPTTYGLLETYKTGSGKTIRQRFQAADGRVYFRTGDVVGWYGSSTASGAFRQIIDTNVSTGSFTMESGYTKQDSGSFVKKVGNIVTWQLRFTNTSQMTSGNEFQVATISSGFRPAQSVWFNGTITTADSSFYVSVLDDGKIYVRPGNNIGASSNIIASGMYFI